MRKHEERRKGERLELKEEGEESGGRKERVNDKRRKWEREGEEREDLRWRKCGETERESK